MNEPKKCIEYRREADWTCYRCRCPICEACSREFGGWCLTCCNETKTGPRIQPKDAR